MKSHPPILNRKLRASRAGLLGTALLAATAFTAQAQNTGFGTTTPASKVTVNGNFAVGKPPVPSTGPKSPYITTAAPIGGAIIEGLTGIGALLPTNQLHVFAAADPVRFEGLLFSTDPANDVPLVVTSQGVVKKSANPATSLPTEFLQIKAPAPYQSINAAGQDVRFGTIGSSISQSAGAASLASWNEDSITLQPGRAYKLTFQSNLIPGNASITQNGANFQFYNATSGAFFGPSIFCSGSVVAEGNIIAFLTPPGPGPTTVKVRSVVIGGTGVIIGSGPADQTPSFPGIGPDTVPVLTVETAD